jgi:hypothetical protein
MSYSEPARAGARRTRWAVRAAVAALSAILIGTLGYQLTTSPSPAAAPFDSPLPHHAHALGETGHLPDGATVFDDAYPGVAKLDGALLEALRRAATDAAGDGVEFYVNSGWRAPAYQDQLLDEAISKYGSREEAAQWVATPQTSPHVSGDAVDLGSEAATWLSEHGAAYGLCQIYDNEPWHYELRPEAVDDGCPAPYADPTRDPRMQG